MREKQKKNLAYMLRCYEPFLSCAIYMEWAISPWSWLWLNMILPGIAQVLQSEMEIKTSVFILLDSFYSKCDKHFVGEKNQI